MQNPQGVQIDIEKEWYGYESVGRYTGEPGIFLYYGDEGVDRNYTTMSVKRQLDGWNWTGKISGHGAHVVFSSLPETDADPLEFSYEEQILAFLSVYKQQHIVRAVTSGNQIPTDEVDSKIDHYTVVVPDGEFQKFADGEDDTFDWYINELRNNRDRVDFVFGHSGKSRVRTDIIDIRKEYLVPNERIWLYPEEDVGYQKVSKVAKELGLRVGLPPNYFRKNIEGIDEEEDEGTDD